MASIDAAPEPQAGSLAGGCCGAPEPRRLTTADRALVLVRGAGVPVWGMAGILALLALATEGQAAASARGYDLSELRARQFTAADFTRFDLILGMDSKNIAEIESLRPPGNTTPVQLFTSYAPETGADHVPDPYFTRDFDGALDLIEAAARGLKAALG